MVFVKVLLGLLLHFLQICLDGRDDVVFVVGFHIVIFMQVINKNVIDIDCIGLLNMLSRN